MGKGKGKKRKASKRPVRQLDAKVAYWLARAPEVRGLRRPATRMRVAALMQRIDPKRLAASQDEAAMAETVADIDELLAAAAGPEYTDWIEQVPFEDGLQIEVLIEYFNAKVFPDLGKGLTSPN